MGAPPVDQEAYDVAVVGAGIAGAALCVYLRRAGFRVVCLDLEPYPHSKVGESLDWSSPWLLQTVGLTAGSLIEAQVATPKLKIAVCEGGTRTWQAAPPQVIRRSPIRFETATLHVDRSALDQRVYEQAVASGAEFVWERVARLETEDDRITGCITSSGRRVSARWYVDASGTARFFTRALDIPIVEYGRQKVCLWTYFDTPPLDSGTTFFLDADAEYLHWLWDIPISPRRTSVGLVVAAETVKTGRQRGLSNAGILQEALAQYPRFSTLLAAQPGFDVQATSFQPYVTTRVCGPNWLIVGEAAAMPDPLTGNGVTSGMRHARLAAAALARAGSEPEIRAADRRTFTRHVHRLGHAFNAHIERVIYNNPIRRGLGMYAATLIYTTFAFFMNAFYTRFDPDGPVAMAVFDGLFVVARAWVAFWSGVARVSLFARGRSTGTDPQGA